MTRRDTPVADPVEPHVIRPAPKRDATGSDSGDNVVDLLKQLAGQGSHLAEQQLALIKAEIASRRRSSRRQSARWPEPLSSVLPDLASS